MNKIHKYLSFTALLLPAFACTEEAPDLNPAKLLESVEIILDERTSAKMYTDAGTGVEMLPMVVGGETVKLAYATVPEDLSEVTFPEMDWSSSDEDVVIVDENGLLTAVGKGTATVTVSSVAYNEIAIASITVNVSAEAEPVTSIAVSADYDLYDEESSIILCYKGDPLQFSAVVSPENATFGNVLWSVKPAETEGGEAVIDAVTGEMTAVANGDVIVTATALDMTDPVSSDPVSVRIIEPQDPTGIRLLNAPEESDIFSLSRKTFTVEYDEYPRYSTVSRIVWTSSDETVATVDEGVVTFNTYGEVTITATCPGDGTLEDGYLKEASFTLNIPSGYYDDVFSEDSWLWWSSDTDGGTCELAKNEYGEWYLKVTPVQGTSSSRPQDWRCDLKRHSTISKDDQAPGLEPFHNNVTFLDKTNYPIICIRLDDVQDNGAENRSIFVDLNYGFEDKSGLYDRVWYGRIGNAANNWTNRSSDRCSDGSSILIYDLSKQNIGSSGSLPDGKIAVFPNFKIGYADIRTFETAEEASYRFFWFKTFRSLEECNAFLAGWSAETGIVYPYDGE